MSQLDTFAVDSAARLVGVRGDPRQAGFQVEREWPNLHADYADTIVVAKNGVRKVYNPTADKQTYSGQFIVSNTRPVEGDDRQINARQTLTKFKPATDTGIDTTAGFITNTSEATLNLFGINTGNDQFTSRSWLYLDNTDTAATNARDVVTVTPPSGFSEANRRFDVGEDRTGTLSILYEKATWSNNVPGFKVFNIDNQGGYGERSTQRATGMAIDSAVNYMADTARRRIGDTWNPDLGATDTEVSFSMTERRKGEGVVGRRVHGGNELDTESAYYPSYYGTPARRERTKYGVHPTNIDTAYAAMKAWIGDTSTDTNFANTGVRKSIAPDGFATITTTAKEDPTFGGEMNWPITTDTQFTYFTRRENVVISKKVFFQVYTYKQMWLETRSHSQAHDFQPNSAGTDSTMYVQPTKVIDLDKSGYKWKSIKTRLDTRTGYQADKALQ